MLSAPGCGVKGVRSLREGWRCAFREGKAGEGGGWGAGEEGMMLVLVLGQWGLTGNWLNRKGSDKNQLRRQGGLSSCGSGLSGSLQMLLAATGLGTIVVFPPPLLPQKGAGLTFPMLRPEPWRLPGRLSLPHTPHSPLWRIHPVCLRNMPNL